MMPDRRTLIGLGAGALGAWLLLGSGWRSGPARAARAGDPRFALSPAQWRQRLSPAAYRVLREEATERPFTSALLGEKRRGTYVCAGCGLPLFASTAKYDSGTGWPSFTAALPGAIGTATDYKLGYPRTEEHCRRCGGHLGHIFDDGPPPTRQRHCINGVALRFVPA